MKEGSRRKKLSQTGSSRLFRYLIPEEIASLLPQHGSSKELNLVRLGERNTETTPVDIKALFLGPKAENGELAEKMLLQVFRDYIFWRRNFHPEDMSAIQPEEQTSAEYQRLVARFQRELFMLLGELKADIPFYSPRYIGHMVADISLPAMVGYLATMLYNPNNVSWEASPITTLIEVEVGRELAKMLGFGNTPQELARTWGHITSGGTVGNLEALWVAKALKFLPIAVRFAAEELNVTGLTASRARIPLESMRAWDLVNLTPTETLDLKDQFIAAYTGAHPELEPQEAVAEAVQQLKAHNILTLGDQAFFSRLTDEDSLNTPVIFASQTMHYSLQKGAGLVGIGAGQVISIPVDKYYRMDRGLLRQALYEALEMQRPVIMVIGVVGSTEEGAVDPMYELVSLREEITEQGLSFFLHCDGAYGGYMAACFRKPSGELRSLAEMQKEYGGWPTSEVHQSFAALGAVDSITVDPHKLGYVPYPAGAVVFRDGRSKELVAQEAAYTLGGRAGHPNEIHLGKFILEGSKPGAAAAAVFLSHRVVPPDQGGYGKLLGHTAKIARKFYHRLLLLAQSIQDDFIVTPLVLPDTNIVDYCFNLANNDRLDIMNRFSQRLYQELSIHPESPVQTRSFIVSHTEFSYANYNPEILKSFLEQKLGVKGDYFVSSKELKQRRSEGWVGCDDEIMVFRTTLMNLFTLEEAWGAKDYIDLFLEEIPGLLRKALAAL